jgi:hypothetical protein
MLTGEAGIINSSPGIGQVVLKDVKGEVNGDIRDYRAAVPQNG